MQVVAINRSYAERIVKEISIDHAIISITDPNSDHPVFQQSPFTKGILKLKFYDIDFGDGNTTPTRAELLKEYGDGLFNKTQAREILNFVEKIKDQVKVIICHCDAGISRSAGVAAAILKVLTGSDKEIFDNKRYVPNRYVYNKILTIHFLNDETM